MAGSNIYIHLTIITVLTVLLTFAGIQTGMGTLLSATGLLTAPQNLLTSNFYVILSSIAILIAGLGVLGAIFASVFYPTVAPTAIKATALSMLFSFVGDYLSILNYSGFDVLSKSLISVIFIPIIVLYLWTVFDWWVNA